MGPMTIARTITTEDEWKALPIGTLARVGFIEHDDDGSETEGGTMTILRVAGDFQANAGDYMLAGGRYWSDIWGWEQGATALDTATIPDPVWPSTPQQDASEDAAEAAVDAAITGHQELLAQLDQMPVGEYVKIPESDLPPESPATAAIKALQDLGWAPPAVHTEGVQV